MRTIYVRYKQTTEAKLKPDNALNINLYYIISIIIIPIIILISIYV